MIHFFKHNQQRIRVRFRALKLSNRMRFRALKLSNRMEVRIEDRH
jgi:hypothetical protein